MPHRSVPLRPDGQERSDNENSLVNQSFLPEDIFAALTKATKLYPHLYQRRDGLLDLDASSADLVLQVALFGEAIFG